jgi:hypothetical protein
MGILDCFFFFFCCNIVRVKTKSRIIMLQEIMATKKNSSRANKMMCLVQWFMEVDGKCFLPQLLLSKD